MHREFRLAFGPRELLHVASLVVRGRVWVELLRELPEDVAARREARGIAAALVHYADQHGWSALGDLAGAMVRHLAGPLDAAAVGRLRLLALRLESTVNGRVLGAPGDAP